MNKPYAFAVILTLFSLVGTCCAGKLGKKFTNLTLICDESPETRLINRIAFIKNLCEHLPQHANYGVIDAATLSNLIGRQECTFVDDSNLNLLALVKDFREKLNSYITESRIDLTQPYTFPIECVIEYLRHKKVVYINALSQLQDNRPATR